MHLMKKPLRLLTRREFAGQPLRQTGFTLIEVMVSTVVLAIGLLGLAGLQVASLTANQSAFMRTQASVLGYDLADRMRANVQGATNGSYAAGTANYTAGCGTTTGCSPLQMAQNDLAEWNSVIATYLPLGQGIVCTDSTPIDGSGITTPQCDGIGNQFAVKIWWDDDRDGIINMDPLNTERFVVSFQL